MLLADPKMPKYANQRGLQGVMAHHPQKTSDVLGQRDVTETEK